MDEKRGRAGFEPIVLKDAIGKKIEYRKGVIDVVAAVPGVAVVPVFNLCQQRGGGGPGHFLQGVLYPFLKIRFQLRLGVAHQRGVSRIQRDVVQVVQIAEHAHLAELRHPGDEQKLEVWIGAFDDAVKVFEDALVLKGGGQLVFFQIIDQRFVILIDEQHDFALGCR